VDLARLARGWFAGLVEAIHSTKRAPSVCAHSLRDIHLAYTAPHQGINKVTMFWLYFSDEFVKVNLAAVILDRFGDLFPSDLML
jgi:hypothetical protein